MFRFAHPLYLYLLSALPLLIAAFIYLRYQRRQKLRRLGDPRLLSTLTLHVSSLRRCLKFVLLLLAYTLTVFMLARPQYGTRSETVKRSGIEAMIAVDVSNSMLCQDVAPSRLEKSKMLVSRLIDQLDDDKVGLVAFAGSAITLLPMTGDQASAHMFLDQLSPASVSLQGTDLGQAIERSVAGFSDKKNVGKALILITDAEDNENAALEAAKAASERGIRIFVLSVGTEEGGVIPLGGNDYKKDQNGNVVTTRLNPEVGKQVAKAAGGLYIHVDQTNSAQHLLAKQIDTMQKDDILTSSYSDYDEQFPAVAILLLIVLLLELCIMEKRNPHLGSLSFLRQTPRATAFLLLLLCSASAAMAQQKLSERDYLRLGNRAFRKADYKKAETFYRKSLDRKASLEAYYNLGNALAFQGQDSLAYEMYKASLDHPSANKAKRAQVYHNMGDLTYASGMRALKTGDSHAQADFQQAVNDFKSSLRLDPQNNATRYNLAMAQYQLKKSQQQGGGGGGKNNQQNKDDDKKKQQQQQQQQQQQKQQQQQQQQSQPQRKDGQMDDQTAEQLLNSAQQDEKQVQRKLKRQPARKRQLEKDW